MLHYFRKARIRIHSGDDMITMTEIARLTNVSQPTVSRVLNGNQNVAAEIRERVLACAKEHNYQCNALAKGLQGSRTMLLGVLLTDISNSFFADLAKKLESEARRSGHSIILFNSDYDMDKEQAYLDVVRRYRVDGVLAVPILQEGSAWPACAHRLDIPVVAVTRHVEGVDSVYLDHTAASGQVARHLAERGYQRFLFIGKKYDMKYMGFYHGLVELGLADRMESMEYVDDQQLQEDLRAYFQQGGPRAGVFANNDICALRVLRLLRVLGVSVPQEAGVVGFDDTYMGPYLNPSLTSISQPTGQIAAEAVSRLLYRMDNPGQLPALDLALPAELVVRESS